MKRRIKNSQTFSNVKLVADDALQTIRCKRRRSRAVACCRRENQRVYAGYRLLSNLKNTLNRRDRACPCPHSISNSIRVSAPSLRGLSFSVEKWLRELFQTWYDFLYSLSFATLNSSLGEGAECLMEISI